MSAAGPDPDDVTRDAWLREALRHAPDAQLAPPADVSQAILRAAQASTRSAAPPRRPRPSWGQRLWMWLARPAVGAGLATVMIGSVVGTMWWDRPLPEATPAPRETVAKAPAAPAAPAETRDLAAEAPAAPPSPAPPAAEARRREATAPEDTLRRPMPAAPRPERQAEAAQGAATGSAQTTAAAPAPAVPPPAPAVAANDAVTQAARTADAMGPAAPALALPELAASRAAAPPPASRPAARTLAKSGATPAGVDRFVASEGQVLDRAFISMRLAVSAEAQRWTWRRGEGPEQPIGDALTAWLAELDAAAASRWQPAAPTTEGASPTLQLLREGRVVHTLRLGADEVRWDAAEAAGAAASRVAPLDPQRARALRQALSRIAP